MAFFSSGVAKATNSPIDTKRWNDSSGVYLVATITSMATSMVFKHFGRKHPVLYIGQWLGPLLIMGLFKKLAEKKVDR